MIILRSKFFADEQQQAAQNLQDNINQQQITSRDLQIEQMKQQRQLLHTMRLREKIQAQERRDAMVNARLAQKQSAQEKDDDIKNQIRITKNQAQDEGAKNVGLYKTRSKAVQPVPMKHCFYGRA